VNRILVISTLLIALLATTGATLQRSAPPPQTPGSQPRTELPSRATPQPYQRQETWYEFLLKQFNPDNTDYGRWIEQHRREFIQDCIRNPYFLYSLCTTIALLFATTVSAKLSIDHRRAMWITAEMMADLYNQDAYSRQVAQEAIERYNQHIERCNRAIETGENNAAGAGADNELERLRTELMRVAEERDTAIRDRDRAREDLRRKSEILAEMSIRLDTLTSKGGAPAAAKTPSDLRGADAKLVTHINNLQEQLYAERNSNRRLRGG
jgi:hypothetical protein